MNGHGFGHIYAGPDRRSGGGRSPGHDHGSLPAAVKRAARKAAKHVSEAVETLTDAMGM